MQKTKTCKRRKRRRGKSQGSPKGFNIGRTVTIELTKYYTEPYEVVLNVDAKEEKLVTELSNKPKANIITRTIRRKETALRDDIIYGSTEYWMLARAHKQRRPIEYKVNNKYIKNVYVRIINTS